jgi:uncharacterized integral membrane protein
MWFIRWLLTLLLMIYAVIFAASNLDQVVLTLPAIPMIHTQPVSLAVVVLLSVGVGIIIWAVVSFIGSIEFRRRIHQLERQNKDLKVELTSLRNKSILDDNELEGADAAVVGTPRPGSLDLPPYDYEREDLDASTSRSTER